MAIDTKHEDLQGLRIDRSGSAEGGAQAPWARRYIIIGISVVVLLSLAALAYRFLAADAAEVEVARATAESSNDSSAATVLSATGYIVAHHKIEANSKVTGRVAWIGVEKGDKVKEGQVLVRLEDQEFRAQYDQARGAAESARAQLEQLQHGSRPEEIQQTEHNLNEARATAANDKITLDRTKNLVAGGVLSQQALDDATAKL
jgi:HlyD family secretion protein